VDSHVDAARAAVVKSTVRGAVRSRCPLTATSRSACWRDRIREDRAGPPVILGVGITPMIAVSDIPRPVLEVVAEQRRPVTVVRGFCAPAIQKSLDRGRGVCTPRKPDAHEHSEDQPPVLTPHTLSSSSSSFPRGRPDGTYLNGATLVADPPVSTYRKMWPWGGDSTCSR
jgi:hypothetical protein